MSRVVDRLRAADLEGDRRGSGGGRTTGERDTSEDADEGDDPSAVGDEDGDQFDGERIERDAERAATAGLAGLNLPRDAHTRTAIYRRSRPSASGSSENRRFS